MDTILKLDLICHPQDTERQLGLWWDTLTLLLIKSSKIRKHFCSCVFVLVQVYGMRYSGYQIAYMLYGRSPLLIWKNNIRVQFCSLKYGFLSRIITTKFGEKLVKNENIMMMWLVLVYCDTNPLCICTSWSLSGYGILATLLWIIVIALTYLIVIPLRDDFYSPLIDQFKKLW